MRASSRHTLVHVSRGAGRLVMGGLRYGTSAGDAAFIPAGVMHAIDLPPGIQGTRFLIPARLLNSAPRTPRRARSPGCEAVAEAEAVAMAAELIREIRAGKPGRSRGIACRAGLLALWIERESQPAARLSTAEALSCDFAGLVESQLGSGRRAADYARALGVTCQALDAACRSVMGRPAEDVVTERLIHEASRQIRRTERTPAEIARRLGLGSEAARAGG